MSHDAGTGGVFLIEADVGDDFAGHFTTQVACQLAGYVHHELAAGELLRLWVRAPDLDGAFARVLALIDEHNLDIDVNRICRAPA